MMALGVGRSRKGEGKGDEKSDGWSEKSAGAAVLVR